MEGSKAGTEHRILWPTPPIYSLPGSGPRDWPLKAASPATLTLTVQDDFAQGQCWPVTDCRRAEMGGGSSLCLPLSLHSHSFCWMTPPLHLHLLPGSMASYSFLFSGLKGSQAARPWNPHIPKFSLAWWHCFWLIVNHPLLAWDTLMFPDEPTDQVGWSSLNW